jgi:hypothetical protein
MSPYMESAGVILGLLLALIPVGYFLYDRYKRAVHRFVPDVGNTFFVYIDNPGYKLNGNIALALYNCRLINFSSKPRAIKEALLEYELNGRKVITDFYSILTGSVFSSHIKAYVNTALIEHGEVRALLMDWNNLRSVIHDNGNLGPGEALSGSALFVLEVGDVKDFKSIKNFRIVVRDYLGAETHHDLPDIDKSNIRGRILHKKFKQHENGSLEFA